MPRHKGHRVQENRELFHCTLETVLGLYQSNPGKFRHYFTQGLFGSFCNLFTEEERDHSRIRLESALERPSTTVLCCAKLQLSRQTRHPSDGITNRYMKPAPILVCERSGSKIHIENVKT